MAYTIGLAQSGYPEDGDVRAQARAYAQRAAEAGCQLVVFPENFMWPHKLSLEELIALAEPVDGPFVEDVAAIMAEHGLWAVFTMNERNPEGGLPFNTAVVSGPDGQVHASYRKCHLYDALGVRESDRLTAGAQLPEPVKTPFCTIGLQICYDLRFAEPARVAALAGCDLLVYPAAWHVGRCKPEQWETLLRARAIENELFVAGTCRSGKGFVGRSLVADPMGRVLAQGEGGTKPDGIESLVVCEVDNEVVDRTRENMPILGHRRPELYGPLVAEVAHVSSRPAGLE
ncbi:MAG: nitrilase-related carbon-nitrogen hydrolase [Coriobacteriia bacterium]|nr:nitrilase-related carbon-nitrogen hydrolase [Coriobacteriia bacterium]